MGDCYFKSIFYQNRGEKIKKPSKHELIIPSESLGAIIGRTEKWLPVNQKPNVVDYRRELQRTINSPVGIFFYESDLWDKEELKRQLHKLVDEI